VAGLAALLHAGDKDLDWWAIRNLILAGGDKVSSLDGKTVSGRRINAAGSMSCSGVKLFGMLSPVATTGSMRQAVEALNINCAKPAGNVSVTINPGSTQLALKDDGTGSDVVAKDGIYTANWSPACGSGDFKFKFSTGKTYNVKVAACVKLDKKSGQAGTSVTVTGSGYTAGEIVDVFFDSKMVDTVDANGQGKISTTVKVPKSADKGKHTIMASGQTSGISAAATFKVT
jgi:hypothetical protein